MIVETKNLINNYLTDRDKIFIDDYLKEIKKKSDNSYWGIKPTIYQMLNFINKKIEDIKKRDIEQYFEFLDNKEYKYTTKNQIRSRLNCFFNYCGEIFFDDYGIEYRNPIPSKIRFEFKKIENDFDLSIFGENQIFNDSELLEILNLSKKRGLREFIIFCLLICCGMRINEVLTIRKSNINLEKRYLITGLIKNARKQDKPLLFFIPIKVVSYLKLYLSHLNDKVDRLFPPKYSNNKKGHYNVKSFYNLVRRNFGENFSHFHKFRDTLITNRVVKLKCPDGFSEGLIGHKGKSVQWLHYIKLTIEGKREIYDQYFPYYHFPYF